MGHGSSNSPPGGGTGGSSGAGASAPGGATYYPDKPGAGRTWEPAEDASAPPGTLYLGGRYRIERKLGVGGCATVYLARDQQLGRKVALKELKPEALASMEMRQRFQNEARAAANLEHDSIVQILDIFEDTDRGPVITMEYASGGDLYGRLRSGGPMSPSDAARMFAEVADGLEAAHQQGIIHRDVKPQNILLSEAGQPKLTDFGIAHVSIDDQDLTSAKVRMGTPDYMAPELNFGAGYATHSSDVYALGASLYYAVTGERPRTIRLEKVPEPLREIVDRCLQEDAQARYVSAGALASSLRAAASYISESSRPMSGSSEVLDDALDEMRWTHRYGKPIGALAVIMVLALIAGATVAQRTNDRPQVAAITVDSVDVKEIAAARQLAGAATDEASVLAALAALDSILDRAPDHAEVSGIYTDLLATPAARKLIVRRRAAVQDSLRARPPAADALMRALSELEAADRADPIAQFGARWLSRAGHQ